MDDARLADRPRSDGEFEVSDRRPGPAVADEVKRVDLPASGSRLLPKASGAVAVGRAEIRDHGRDRGGQSTRVENHERPKKRSGVYAVAVAALHPELPSNPWHQALRRYFTPLQSAV